MPLQIYCLNTQKHGKRRQSMKGSSKRNMDVGDYVLCGLAGLLIVIVIIGTLWEAFSRVRQRDLQGLQKALFFNFKR